MTVSLTQDEADVLLCIEKYCNKEEELRFPGPGEGLQIPLFSMDGEEFILDVTRARICIEKITYQNRVLKTIILTRVDMAGRPHRNPDGEHIPCPHIHLYREGYGDKWAQALPEQFSDETDFWQTLQDFMEFCHIVKRPKIQRLLIL